MTKRYSHLRQNDEELFVAGADGKLGEEKYEDHKLIMKNLNIDKWDTLPMISYVFSPSL